MNRIAFLMVTALACFALAACGGANSASGGNSAGGNDAGHNEAGHSHEDGGHHHEGEAHDLGHKMQNGIHFGAAQLGELEAGGEAIFEVHVMQDDKNLTDAQVAVWIGEKDGKELSPRGQGSWVEDEKVFDCHVKLPGTLPDDAKLFVLIRVGDKKIQDSFELDRD